MLPSEQKEQGVAITIGNCFSASLFCRHFTAWSSKFITFLQVFFCVMVGSFSLGNAAPNIGTLFGAKGAAAVVFEIIDNVSFVIN